MSSWLVPSPHKWQTQQDVDKEERAEDKSHPEETMLNSRANILQLKTENQEKQRNHVFETKQNEEEI